MRRAGHLTWVSAGGGPLLLLDRRFLPRWLGDTPASPHAGTDYDRACAIDDYVGLVNVGSGHGLVLDDEPLQTAWWPAEAIGGGILVRWRWAPDEMAVVRALGQLEGIVWQTTGCTLPVATGDLLLFDAADSGAAVSDCLSIALRPGDYDVTTTLHSPDRDTALILHRLIPTIVRP